MARFELKVVSVALTEVKDLETGKVYKCKNTWNHRDTKQGRVAKFYVDVTPVPTRNMGANFTFPYTGVYNAEGKLPKVVGTTAYSDLSGRTSSTVTADMFEL